MKAINRIFPIILLIGSTVLMTGCSYTADFVLKNATEKVLTIRYWIRRTSAIPFVILKARVASSDQHAANPHAFNAFPDERIRIGNDSMSATVRLLPGEVLFLTELDIRDIAAEPTFKSGIRKLSVETETGAVVYEGDQVYRQFVPSQDSFWPGSPLLYTLTINE